jgi:hypothetical protein
VKHAHRRDACESGGFALASWAESPAPFLMRSSVVSFSLTTEAVGSGAEAAGGDD